MVTFKRIVQVALMLHFIRTASLETSQTYKGNSKASDNEGGRNEWIRKAA